MRKAGGGASVPGADEADYPSVGPVNSGLVGGGTGGGFADYIPDHV